MLPFLSLQRFSSQRSSALQIRMAVTQKEAKEAGEPIYTGADFDLTLKAPPPPPPSSHLPCLRTPPDQIAPFLPSPTSALSFTLSLYPLPLSTLLSHLLGTSGV